MVNARHRVSREPWGRAGVARLVVISGAGGLICLLAWNGAATRTQLDDQTAWVSLGVLGLVVTVAGEALWLRHARRAVGRYRDHMLGRLSALTGDVTQVALAGPGEGLVATAGMKHYHRPDCPIAAPRDWLPEPRSAHEAAGRTPCGICRP